MFEVFEKPRLSSVEDDMSAKQKIQIVRLCLIVTFEFVDWNDGASLG